MTPYEQYINLPEGAPYQLISGKLVMTPSPVPLHQFIVGQLYMILRRFVNQQRMGQFFVAPLDVHFDEYNVCQQIVAVLSVKK